MHVGHLRSTIIGDTLARVLELRGHDVLRLNHVGDWGTQFGMLITQLRAEAPAAVSGEQRLDISELVALYKRAKAAFDESDDFKKTSREEVVKLQAGDAESVKAWRALCEQSEVAFQKVYDTLRVDERLETRGESFYNNKLGETVKALKEGSLLKESDGAQVVYAEDGSGAPIATNRDGDPMPMIVQKSDGGYMYSTTDLAAVRQRVTDEAAARVLYVTDAGQAQHFEQVFAISRKAGFAPDGVSLEHVPFGLVLGEDGKKFKTRSGETVKLVDLLDEALSRAKADVSARLEAEGREADAADPEFVDRVSRAVGIGAVKYADLSMNRMSNYKFSYDKMLALSGNTAPYMLYAYARIRGIQRKAAEAAGADAAAPPSPDDLQLEAPAEYALARHIMRLPAVVAEVEGELLPSKLCEYIFELAGRFNQFYEALSVVNAESEEARRSRLALCALTAATLRLNLELLGIEPLERL
jgi:arginyl-tRNA synthetase